MAETIDLKKGDHGSMFDRQFKHRVVQFFLELPDIRITINTCLICQGSNDFLRNWLLGINALQAEKRQETLLAQVTPRRIHRNAIQPCEKRRLAPEPVDGLEGLDESVLGQVSRVLPVRRHVIDEAVNPLPIFADESIKSGDIHGLHFANDLKVRVGLLAALR